MPSRLRRFQETGDLHFVTFSCLERRPFLRGFEGIFATAFETVRIRYQFSVAGYVVMPEHVHLLFSEPEVGNVGTVIQAVKQSVGRKVVGGADSNPTRATLEWGTQGSQRFWEMRYYDFNVWTDKKRIEKLKYMHRNPVKRGLVMRPEDWKWSSFRYYLLGEEGVVKIGL